MSNFVCTKCAKVLGSDEALQNHICGVEAKPKVAPKPKAKPKAKPKIDVKTETKD